MISVIAKQSQIEKDFLAEVALLDKQVQRFKKLQKVFKREILRAMDKKKYIARDRLILPLVVVKRFYSIFFNEIVRLESYVKRTMPQVVIVNIEGEAPSVSLSTQNPQENYAAIKDSINFEKSRICEAARKLKEIASVYKKV
jgi:hypothetical protein